MNPKFYTSSQGDLVVEMDGERDALIVNRGFLRSESRDKAADYLRTIAAKLNEIYPTDPDKAQAILEEAKQKVADAKLAEKCLEEIVF